MIFLSSSGTRFVLKFELHDSSLNGFLDTAIFSSSSPPRFSCWCKLYVPEEGSVCSSLSRCLIFSTASIMHRLSWSSLLSSESSSHSPDNFSSSASSSTVGHSPDSCSSPRCSASSLNALFFFLTRVCPNMSSGILSRLLSRSIFLLRSPRHHQFHSFSIS